MDSFTTPRLTDALDVCRLKRHVGQRWTFPPIPAYPIPGATMDLAWISLAALIVVIVVSCTTAVNPGVLSVALAWVIGVFVAPALGISLGIKDVLAGFPSDLFLTLVGVTLLFTQAQVNGTLERVSRLAVYCCRGNVGLMPVM